MTIQYSPSDYQVYATNYIETHDKAFLMLSMGLGKTVITLTALADLLALGDVDKVLVIAPLNVARTVWAEECQKWDHLQHIRCSKILGTAAERTAAMRDPAADIYIVNRENVPWLVEACIKARKWPYDCVVIDEMSSFKARNTARFKALIKARNRISRMIALSGTPAPNSLLDLWPQMYLLDQGERLGKFISRYREQYFMPAAYNPRNGIVYKYSLKPGAADMIYNRIRDISVSMSAEDYVKLPDRIDRIVNVVLPEDAMAAYRQFAKDLILPIGPDEKITAAGAAVLCNKLLQCASGAVYDDSRQVITLHDAKLQALREIVDTATGPVLIFYAYRHEVDRIKQAIPGAVQLKGAEQVEQWNQGKIPVLLAHPDSAGHGLNLQAGGHVIIWYSLTWSLEKYQQACARLHRRGQREPVIIHHLVSTGTIDERVLQVLQGKDEGQKALLKAVAAVIDEVRRSE